MTDSFDSPRKSSTSNEAGTPHMGSSNSARKLERLNAKNNTMYVPQNESSHMGSLQADISRIGGTIAENNLRSFRILGNNLEEEIQNICLSTGITKQEFVGGISQESWQSVSDQRKSRSGSLFSNQLTSMTDYVVEPTKNLEPWSKGTSQLSNSPLTIENKSSGPSFGNSPGKSFESAVSGDTTYLNGDVNRALAGVSNIATSKSASVASSDKFKTSYQDKQDSFLDSTFYADRKANVASSSSQHIYRPSVQIQGTTELDTFVDNKRASYPLTSCDLDTTSSPFEFSQKDLRAGTAFKAEIVNRIEERSRLQKFEHNEVSRLSPSTPRTFPKVLETSVPATSGFYLKKQDMYPTSQVELFESMPYSMGQKNISWKTESKSSNAVLNLSAKTDGIHDELLMKKSVFRERPEDSANGHLPVVKQMDMVVTSEREIMSAQTDNAAEQQTISLNEEMAQSGQTMNIFQQSHRLTLARSLLRTPWSFWKKGGFLGSGSFGTVYEGVNSEGLFFAVKEVPLGSGGGAESILQLEQEIEILSQFQHENIVQYLGTQREADKLYIFLEFMTKGALSSLYKKIQLFDTQIRSYTRQILCGLKYLHQMDIVHRDVKCANILVHANGTVKLADFGMARVLKKSEQLKSCKGSAYWMAPEVINPKKTYSFPADIWSLGCTVLEMATGSPPFDFLEWNTVLWKVGHGEIPPIPDKLQDDAKDFIRQCLQVDSALRPTADDLLEHPYIKSKHWRATSIHSSKQPVLVEINDSSMEDFSSLDEPSSSQGISSYSSSDSSTFGDDEPKVRLSGSKFSAHSVRTRRSTRMFQ